jgi:hypothetical protein
VWLRRGVVLRCARLWASGALEAESRGGERDKAASSRGAVSSSGSGDVAISISEARTQEMQIREPRPGFVQYGETCHILHSG